MRANADMRLTDVQANTHITIPDTTDSAPTAHQQPTGQNQHTSAPKHAKMPTHKPHPMSITMFVYYCGRMEETSSPRAAPAYMCMSNTEHRCHTHLDTDTPPPLGSRAGARRQTRAPSPESETPAPRSHRRCVVTVHGGVTARRLANQSVCVCCLVFS